MPTNEMSSPSSNIHIFRPRTPYYLDSFTLGDLNEWLIRPGSLSLCVAGKSTSTDLVSKIVPLLAFNPDCLLFTAYSALPMADVFRGIYQAAAISSPEIGVITTNRDYLTPKIDPVSIDIRGRKTAIIDQYYGTGSTIKDGIELAQTHGASYTMPITGRWYHQANMDTLSVDKAAVTSRLASELQVIGRNLLNVAIQGTV